MIEIELMTINSIDYKDKMLIFFYLIIIKIAAAIERKLGSSEQYRR